MSFASRLSPADDPLSLMAAPESEGMGTPGDRAASLAPTARLRRMIDDHYDVVWRTVRFHGTPDASAEDVTQQVFCIAARKLETITAGLERPFLLSVAWRVASEQRRSARRRPVASGDDGLDVVADPFPSPEELLDQKRARAELQTLLDAMPSDLRMVFVLFELEELSLPEIAAATGLRLGTATSRLRRAREEFQSILKRRSAAASRGRGARS
jgi:RNA polymerase sigma-70 factor (ECF subfamily)